MNCIDELHCLDSKLERLQVGDMDYREKRLPKEINHHLRLITVILNSSQRIQGTIFCASDPDGSITWSARGFSKTLEVRSMQIHDDIVVETWLPGLPGKYFNRCFMIENHEPIPDTFPENINKTSVKNLTQANSSG